MSQLDLSEEAIDADNYDFARCRTRMFPDGPYSTLDVVAALRKTVGNFSLAAALLGRPRAGLVAFVRSNREVLEVYVDLRETVIDAIEDKVLVSAMAGDGPNARFVLSTLGKTRGYSQRTELTGAEGGPIAVSEIRHTIIDAKPIPEDIDMEVEELILGDNVVSLPPRSAPSLVTDDT